MKKLFYVHGAGRNGSCFDIFRGYLPPHEAHIASYDCFARTIQDIVSDLSENAPEEEFAVVGHSLGGILGLLMAHQGAPITRIFSIATPFGGSEVATFWQFAMQDNCSLLRNIALTSPYVWKMLTTPLPLPVRSIVATGGSNILLPQPNDGVVSVMSQMALRGADYYPVNLSHSEVLMSEYVASIAEEFLFID